MASGFNPKSIAGLQLWLDAADSGSLTLNGSTVSEWRDKSATGSVWTQATAASQPTSGSQTMNGRNVLVFDGSNDWLSAVSPLATSMPLTFFLVQRIVAGTSFGMTYTAATGFNVRQTGATSGILVLVPGAGAGTGTSRTGSNDILAITYPSSGSNTLFVNGASFTLDDTTSRPTLTGTHSIGVRRATDGSLAFYANVWVAEILAYSTLLTTTQRVAVQKYLGKKWGITVA